LPAESLSNRSFPQESRSHTATQAESPVTATVDSAALLTYTCLTMKAQGLIAVLVLLAVAHPTRADIVEWQDADGVRHFTNGKVDVPSTGPARVVVAERGVQPPAPVPEPAPADQPARQAQVVYDYSQITEAYVRGLEQGLALARGDGGNGVTINGPLALAGAGSGSDPWFPYYDKPRVTTSFDHGRSRHRTLRMLLQDQFQIDRDGPFVSERLPPGLGPNLNPFLPRGLPHGFPVGLRVRYF
jgi:hypothetical protein